MQKFLIVIDMQNDFIDGSLGSEAAQAIVPCVQKRIEDALEEGGVPVFTMDTHQSEYLSTHEGKNLPVTHCVEGTPGWNISPELDGYAKIRLTKPTFGCLALVDLLAETAEKDGSNLDISLCGVCTDICVISNALLLRAHFPEATIRLFVDSCAGTSVARHEAAIAAMQSCQIEMA